MGLTFLTSLTENIDADPFPEFKLLIIKKILNKLSNKNRRFSDNCTEFFFDLYRTNISNYYSVFLKTAFLNSDPLDHSTEWFDYS